MSKQMRVCTIPYIPISPDSPTLIMSISTWLIGSAPTTGITFTDSARSRLPTTRKTFLIFRKASRLLEARRAGTDFFPRTGDDVCHDASQMCFESKSHQADKLL